MREPAPLYDERGNRAVEQEGQPQAASCCTEIGCEDASGVSDVALAAVQRFLFVAAVFCVCVVTLLLIKVFQ